MFKGTRFKVGDDARMKGSGTGDEKFTVSEVKDCRFDDFPVGMPMLESYKYQILTLRSESGEERKLVHNTELELI